MKNDSLYLIDMLEIARRVEQRVSRLARADFDTDEDVQLALTHLLQMIGEAAYHVSDSTRTTLPQIPWNHITGMRHRIVHDYLYVNLEVVWESATRSVPDLIRIMAPIIDPIIAQAKKQGF